LRRTLPFAVYTILYIFKGHLNEMDPRMRIGNGPRRDHEREYLSRETEVRPMRKITALLLLGSLFLGTGLSVAASAAGPDLDGMVYWAEEEVDSLFSPELMRALALTPSQRSTFQELRGRDWGYRPDQRYSGGLDAIFSLGGMIRPGGPRVVIERENDNFRTFLALLAFGLLLSQAQDTDRYYDPGYGYDYGYGYGYGYGPGRWIRIDDFLYLFFRILDMNQRYTFKIYFDRWYDDYYYRPDRFRDYHYRYYREAMRDWDRRLHLSEKQRRDMERYYDDLYKRRWDRERRYRDLEKDYLKRNWDRDSFRDIDRYRRDLLQRRRESLTPPRDSRDRFRSILDDGQRKTFDSLIRERENRQGGRERPTPPKFQDRPVPPKYQGKPAPPNVPNRPAPPKFQEKPAPPKFQEKPVPPKFQEKPAPPKFQEKPAPPKFQEKPAPPKAPNKPAPPKFQEKPVPPKAPNKPAPPKFQEKPAPPKAPNKPVPPILTKNPGPAPGQKKPLPPVVTKPVKDGK